MIGICQSNRQSICFYYLKLNSLFLCCKIGKRLSDCTEIIDWTTSGTIALFISDSKSNTRFFIFELDQRLFYFCIVIQREQCKTLIVLLVMNNNWIFLKPTPAWGSQWKALNSLNKIKYFLRIQAVVMLLISHAGIVVDTSEPLK
jgi:hypothetical protein